MGADPVVMSAGPEDGSGSAAEAGDYEGPSEPAAEPDMMKYESLSTAAAAAIAARAAAAARLREEEQKRRLLEEDAVGAPPLSACDVHEASHVILMALLLCTQTHTEHQIFIKSDKGLL